MDNGWTMDGQWMDNGLIIVDLPRKNGDFTQPALLRYENNPAASPEIRSMSIQSTFYRVVGFSKSP